MHLDEDYFRILKDNVSNTILQKQFFIFICPSAPISRVQSVFSYNAPDPLYLSFSQHEVIQVFAKDVDESGLWTGEV